MIFVNTGYLFALFNPQDAHYPRAQAWSAAVSESLITTEYIYLEAVNAFSARQFRRRAITIIQFLNNGNDIEVLPISLPIRQAGITLFDARIDKSWSLTDCVSFYVMGERNVTSALAHDHHFEQAGFEALLRRDT